MLYPCGGSDGTHFGPDCLMQCLGGLTPTIAVHEKLADQQSVEAMQY
jgi:hypothetical protein